MELNEQKSEKSFEIFNTIIINIPAKLWFRRAEGLRLNSLSW
jgi:hypothetical protein